MEHPPTIQPGPPDPPEIGGSPAPAASAPEPPADDGQGTPGDGPWVALLIGLVLTLLVCVALVLVASRA